MTNSKNINKQEKQNWITRLNQKREDNSSRFKTLNMILMILFPIFITCMAEINQFKKVSSFFAFAADRPTVLFFDIVIAALVFVFLLAVFRKGWVASMIQSFIYMALSIVELFKYGTNGNHLILSDMKLFKSVKSLKSFAYIRITPRLIIYCLIVVAVALIIAYFNPKLPRHIPVKRLIACLCCVAPCVGLIIFPSFYNPIYKFFKLDTTAATNAFILNEKFDSNSFLAFIVETASESYANRLREPDNYTEDYVEEITDVKADTSEDFNGGKKPNVVVIMSESYADFRVFDELNVDDKYYEGFDKAVEEGYGGIAITPTYASYTVRSEFELLFGLPVRGLNAPNMPQRELADREQPALAQYYKSWGYSTAYVHPFQSNFYSRAKIYGEFGFDKMIFHDDIDNVSDFTVPVEHYGTYVDDKTVYDQLIDLIKTTDDPLYVHTTTMQNHQPYNQGEGPDDEFGNYLQWIQHSNEGLTVFLDELKNIDEPTLVFFVGDHFPSLRGETSVYNQLYLDGVTCSVLYEQRYFIWSNYDADYSKIPDNKVSFFYMPYVLLNIIDAPRDAFIEKMNEFMETLPVYSIDYDDTTPDNEELDVLAYDRVIGEVMSPCPIPDELLETSKNSD
ncbi:MAG TPA: sulfatase-like hydrolase/transferase [Ruminococcus sp.]|nr:sulfatase-like hydrolase/transferase [Ruminococcus sp.]